MANATLVYKQLKLSSRYGVEERAYFGFDLSEYLPDGYYIKSATLTLENYQQNTSTSTYGKLTISEEEIAIGTTSSHATKSFDVIDRVKQTTLGVVPAPLWLVKFTNDTSTVRTVVFTDIRLTIEYEPLSISCDLTGRRFIAGTAFTITPTLTRPDSTYNATIYLNDNASISTTNVAYGESCTFTIPVSWAQYITTSRYTTVKVKLSTSAKAQGGTRATKLTVNADDIIRPLDFNSESLMPTINSVSIVPVNDVLNDPDTYIVGRKLRFAIKDITLLYGASVSGATLTDYNGTSYSLTYSETYGWYVELSVNDYGSNKAFRFNITDSRSLTASYGQQIDIVKYELPKLTNYYVQRGDIDGNADDTGDYLWAYAVFSCTPFTYQSGTKLNDVTCALAYKVETATAYTDSGTLETGVSAMVGGTGKVLSGDDAYIIKYTITDALTAVEKEITVEAAAYTMHFQAGGKAVWVGDSSNGKPKQSFGVGSKWTSYFTGDIYFGGKFDSGVYSGGHKVSNELCLRQSFTATILSGSANWIKQSDGSYGQSIAVSGLLPQGIPFVDVNLSGKTMSEAENISSAMQYVYRAVTSDNELYVYSTSNSLPVDVPVKICVIYRLADEPEVGSNG